MVVDIRKADGRLIYRAYTTVGTPRIGEVVQLDFMKTHGGMFKEKWVDKEVTVWRVTNVAWTYWMREGQPGETVTVVVEPVEQGVIGNVGEDPVEAATLANLLHNAP